MRLAGPLLALLAALGCAGCAREAPPAGSAAESGIYRRGNGAEPDSLDPQLARSDNAGQILRDVYEGLTVLDARAEPVPGAAERWELSADGLTYTFHLRDGARWSNGEPLTAADYVAAWRRLVDPATAAPYAAMLEPIAHAAAITAGRTKPAELGVSATDARTLTVQLVAPAPYFPGLVAHWSTFPAWHGAAPAAAGATVSNGAYTLAAWIVGSHVALKRNRRYWNDAATHIESVRFLPIADPNDEYARYRAGELESTYTVPQQPIERLKTLHGAALHLGPQLGIYYYGFNLTKPPFKDARELRQALAMTVDRERLVGQVTGLGELPAYSWVPPGVAGYEPQRFAWADRPYAERVSEARRLYAAAGYSSARPLKVELRYPNAPTSERIAIAVAAMWQDALGVETRLAGEQLKSLLEAINRGETEIFNSGWQGDYDDASTFTDVLKGGTGINLPHYRSSAYDAALANAGAAVDPAVRRSALEAAERTVLADAPVVPLYFYVNKHLVAARVRGWHDNVMNVVYTKDLELVH
jgi:oligopeptide transport system substrate-binding protein